MRMSIDATGLGNPQVIIKGSSESATMGGGMVDSVKCLLIRVSESGQYYCGEAARRSRSVARQVVTRLNNNKEFWLPLGVGATFVGGSAAISHARSLYRESLRVEGRANVRTRMFRKTHARDRVTGNFVEKVVKAGNAGLDVETNTGGLLSLGELTSELKMFTAFKTRDYALLQQCCARASQWLRSRPDDFPIPARVLHRYLYGSVVAAIRLSGEEKRALRYMDMSGAYEATVGFRSGKLSTVSFFGMVMGRESVADYFNSFFVSTGGIGPTAKH